MSNDIIHGRGKSLKEVLECLTHLRHTSVHRTVLSLNPIDESLMDAERLATCLEDDNSTTRIVRQRGALELAIDEIKRNKKFPNYGATETIQDLTRELRN